MENNDNIETILINILEKLKVGFKNSRCNKTAAGFLTSYNIVKEELKKHNPEIDIKNIR